MASAADISPGLASALAAASLASQQAQRAADAFDAKQASGFSSAATIPTQHWELLRVAELLTKGLNVAHVQQQQHHLSMMGVTATSTPPPLFLPSIGAHQGVPSAPGSRAQPVAAGQGAGGLAGGSLPLSVSAVMAGVTSAGLQMALASATQAAMAAKLAAEGASPLHTEPHTPELAMGELRSPSFPVAGQREEAPTPQLQAKHGGGSVTATATATTTLVRPVAVRPALPAGAVAMCQSSSPRAMSGAPTVISSALVPTATGSPGAAFSPVMRGQQQPATPSPAASCELPPAAVAPKDGSGGGREPSPKPSPKPSPRLSTGSAKTAGSPMMRGMPAPPPLALSPRGAGVRKRRGGPVSPGRGASRASLDTTVSAAGLEGCADSMDCNDVGGLEGEPTKGYKGRFCGRLFLKEDEKRLAAECELLGPLIGFPGPGKRGHCTVAKLARAIVAGSVRRTCESRAAEIQELKAQLAEAAAVSARAARLEAENAALRRELAARK